MSTQLAIDGGAPVRTTPFHPWPVFGEAEERNLLEVLHSGKWGVLTGTKVTAFEQKFSAFQGAQFGICVPNGTLALEMSLRAMGIGPGDEVITTPYTFIATASSILLTGATLVFADIDPSSYSLNPAKVEAALSEHTRAIVPVHLGGRPADMDALLALAKKLASSETSRDSLQPMPGITQIIKRTIVTLSGTLSGKKEWVSAGPRKPHP